LQQKEATRVGNHKNRKLIEKGFLSSLIVAGEKPSFAYAVSKKFKWRRRGERAYRDTLAFLP